MDCRVLLSLEAVLRIQAIADDAIAQIERVQAGLEGIESTATRGNGIAEMGDRLQQTGFYMRDLGQSMTQNVTMPLVGAVQEAMSFEDSMAEVAKAANLDQDGMQQMQQTILEMSRQIPRSANELANMAAAGGRLGVATDDLDDFVRLTSNMAVAFDMGADQAGQAAAEIANNFKMMDTATGTVDFERLQTFGNVVNNLADNMATTEARIVNFTKRASGVGQTFGMAEQDVAAFGAAFTALGIAPEKASTAFNGVVQKLAMATELPEKAAEGFQQLGLDAAAMQEAFASGNGTEAMLQFLDAVEQGGPEAGAALNKIIGAGFSDEMLQAAGGLDQFRKAFEKSEEAVLGGGSTMADSFDVMAGTSGASLELLQNGLTEIAIVAGSVLLPAMNSLLEMVIPIVHGFAAFAQAHPGITKVAVAIAAVVAAVGPLLVIAGTIVGAIGTIASAWGAVSAAFAAGGVLSSGVLGVALSAIASGAIAVASAFASLAALAGVIVAIPALIFKMGAAATGVNIAFSEMPQIIGMALQASAARVAEIPGAIMAVLNLIPLAFLSIKSRIMLIWAQMMASLRSLAASGISGIVAAMVGGMAQVVGAIASGAAQAVAAITSMGSQMISAVTGIAGQMFAAGANIVARLADGIRSGIGAVTGAMSSVANAARSMLPMSPVPHGPLTVLNNTRTNPGAKIVQMLASGMRSAVGSGIMSNALQGALPSGLGGGLSSGGGGGGGINIGGITLNINVNGGGDAAGSIADALRRELPDVLEEIMGNRQRVGYSG